MPYILIYHLYMDDGTISWYFNHITSSALNIYICRWTIGRKFRVPRQARCPHWHSAELLYSLYSLYSLHNTHWDSYLLLLYIGIYSLLNTFRLWCVLLQYIKEFVFPFLLAATLLSTIVTYCNIFTKNYMFRHCCLLL